jgi:hypothetical protein
MVVARAETGESQVYRTAGLVLQSRDLPVAAAPSLFRRLPPGAGGGDGGIGGQGASETLLSDGAPNGVVGGATRGALSLTQSAVGGDGGFGLARGGAAGNATSILLGNNPSLAITYRLSANATGGNGGSGQARSGSPGGVAVATTTAASLVARGTVGASSGAVGGEGGITGTESPGANGEPGGDSTANSSAVESGSRGTASAASSALGGMGHTAAGAGGEGGTATASAAAQAINRGTAAASVDATGGSGGDGGRAGGAGGDANATAGAIASGSAAAKALATGGAGGGDSLTTTGAGGSANASAQSSALANGPSLATPTATGGAGGMLFAGHGGAGGHATAASESNAMGAGTATATATATGGVGPGPARMGGAGGNATATANSTAFGSGAATATASAMGGAGGQSVNGGISGATGSANASSTAKTAKGALAHAQSTAIGSSGQAQSTALTSYSFVRVQSAAVAQVGGAATTSAIAQGGGSGQAFANPGQTAYAFSTDLPDKAYSATLIDGAHDVAGALLGPRDTVFGTAVLGANYAADGGGESHTYSATSTFDFGYGGDLLLGLISSREEGFAGGLGFQSLEFTITADGVEILDTTFRSLSIAESFFKDSVLEPVREEVESTESFVIHCRHRDSGGLRCGRTRTGVVTTAGDCAIRAT